MDKRESERRQATILFADISGFTAMSEKLDPEEVTAIMGDCFAFLGKIVTEYGGAIDKFMGDCVMALFGAPKALEGAPEKAVSAALRMRRELEAFNKKRKLVIPLGIHIGINSGEVLSGELGSAEKKDFTVMGDAVNIASRLKDLAEKGRILVGPLTWRYARGAFRFVPLKPVSVKGKEEPVQVYEVAGGLECADAGNPERMIQSALIGRECELATIEEKAKELLKGGGSVVNLIGEAGIGKSRLCAELYTKDLMKGITVLEGRAIAVGQTLSYYPIIVGLKSWASISEEDAEETAFFKLESAIRAVIPEQAEDIVPCIATLMGYKLAGKYANYLEGVSGESLAKIIAKRFKDLIVKASGFRPILFALEDLHWADESTFELLRIVVTLSAKHPVMFLCAWRPGYEETTGKFRAYLAENLPERLVDIELAPLEEGQSEELARNLLRNAGIPERVIVRIIEKAGGNPFFIEEVIRSFIDMGFLKIGKSGFTVSADIESIDIPNSIDAVIMSRIDRLDEAMRELLRIASVIGRSFFFSVLSRVHRNGADLGGCILKLEEMQLIRDRMRMDEIEYLFKHVLVQETIYRSILMRSRKELHLEVARAIEELFAARLGEFYGVLAFHYMQAEELDKAEEFLEKAGKAALDSAASSEALVFFQQALAIYRQKSGKNASPERIAQFERIIAKAFQNKGLMRKAVEHYDAALEYYGIRRRKIVGKAIDAAAGFLSVVRFLYLPSTRSRKKPTETEVEIIRIMNDREWAVGNVDSTEYFLSGFSVVRRFLSKNPFHISSGLSLLCVASQLLSATGISFALANKILDFVGPNLKTDLDRSIFKDAEQFVHLFSGMRDCRYEKELVDFFVRQGDFARAGLYLAFCGICSICRGDFAEAEGIAGKAREIAEGYEDEGSLTKYLENITLRNHATRTVSATLDDEDALISTAGKIGEHAVLKLFTAYKADALMLRGDMEAAAGLIEEINTLMGEESILLPVQALPPLMSILSYNIRRYLSSINVAERNRVLKETRPVLKRIRKYGPKYMFRYPEALRLAGTFNWLAGRQHAALSLWKEGLAIAEKLDLKPELGRISFEVAKLLSSTGSRFKTLGKLPPEHYAKVARDVFTDIGLDVDLKELNDWEREQSPSP